MERRGNGTIRLTITEKEKQRALAEKIVTEAKADGLDAKYEEGVSWLDNETPEYIVTLPHATGKQMTKYGNIMTYGKIR